MFIHEIKQNLRTFLLWCLGMLLLIALCVGKTGGMTASGGQGLGRMVELLPKSLHNLFGMGVVNLGTPIGVFAILSLYVALIAAYHASGLGVSSFAKEERDRTFEFLYVRGRRRPQILWAKVACDLAQLTALNAFTYAVGVFIVLMVEGQSIAGGFLPMMLGVFVLQLLFYAVGLFASFASRRMRTAGSVSSAIVMALFLVHMLTMIVHPSAWVSYLSPFKYFDGKAVLAEGFHWGAALLWTMAAAAMVAASFALHSRRDLHT